ncbi:hypothetical protein ACA910_021741 [Epithemia clementina (nom. ined.)]
MPTCSSQPLLGICMSHVLIPSQTDGMDQEEITDKLYNLIRQEGQYSCGDYLNRQRSHQHVSSDDEEMKDEKMKKDEADPNSVDASCREKMCEWSYRVCDHFKVPRNIVAIAFSFLDRFVNRCSCDRTAFKLASMTALYMATKVFNGRQLSISTLAELSRGEFDVCHISEMELIMLRTLDWKLNPPTVQDFIQFFLTFLPAHCCQTTFIAQRAMFFAELCVYDYDLVLHSRALIAQASIMNAIQAVLREDPELAREMESMLLDAIQFYIPSCGLQLPSQQTGGRRYSEMVKSTQRRLWYLFSCSVQSVEEKSSLEMSTSERNKLRRSQQQALSDSKQQQLEPKSPTSVHQVASVSPTCVDNRF